MKVFDGNKLAEIKESVLQKQVTALKEQGKQIHIAALLFDEDQGSRVYTRLKKEAAERVGMKYQVHTFSFQDDLAAISQQIKNLNHDQAITGIIIQKPWRKSWIDQTKGDKKQFDEWWHSLVGQIDLKKDVDGLHPQTLAAVKDRSWKQKGYVLPATAQAVLEIIDQAKQSISIEPKKTKVIVIGKSDILGKPLTYELRNRNYQVEMIGSKELRQRISSGQGLSDANIVVSSTGRNHLVTGDLVKEGVIVIDVGEPQPDVDFRTVSQKAAFITPVPGGVGPMTVICLLENAMRLILE